MKSKLFALATLIAIAPLALTACETAGQGTATGAATGGVLGAGAGALLDRHHSGAGAIIGGVAGAAGGALLGHNQGQTNERMNRQDAEIDQARQDANTQIVNVPVSTGGVVPVKMVRQGTVWIGPRGESYPYLPTPEALRPAYGF